MVAGSRLWRNASTVNNAVQETWIAAGKPSDTIIVCNDTPGPGMIIEKYAPKLGFTIERHEVDWGEGSSARLQQYKKMADSGADICLMFIRNESPGAKKFVELAEAANIPVKIWRE
jgi:hypothetical protein